MDSKEAKYIAKIKKMSPLERFLYWIEERHRIYKKKESGEPKPWTEDPVFRGVFFTNPYRENDRTSKWFRANIRNPRRNDSSVFFSTVCFRWFNLIKTGQRLMGDGMDEDLTLHWHEGEAVRRLRKQNESGPVFTGAFMIKAGNGPPGCKIPLVCSSLTDVWNAREEILATDWDTLKSLWQRLKHFRGLGGFMAYEIVTDLRHTHILDQATDIDTWANPGPGCMRGLARLEGKSMGTKKVTVSNPQKKMRDLLAIMRKRLKGMPPFDLRCVEHSCCEVDKYCRALFKEGKLKRKYNGY